MAQHREITLRNVKGTALTYAEMDQNLSSFFYSASLSSTNLLLHYTGSTTLGAAYTPASITVPLNPLLATIQQLTVAGNNVGDIQYRINPSTLGANSAFKWDTVNSRLGVGVATPVATLHIDSPGKTTPTTLRINTRTLGTKVATLDYYLGNTQVGTVGKAVGNTEDMYTIVSNGANSAYTQIGSTKVVQISSLGQGIFTTPNTELTVKGVIGVGTDTGANQGLLGNIITPQYPGGRVLASSLPTNSTLLGLLIESPKKLSGTKVTGGHVVIGVNSITTNQKYAFSVLTNNTTGIYSTPLLTVQANGKTGINNANPVEALDIVGNTTMTGNINVGGTATIGTVTDSLGANSQILTRDSTTGLVQYTTNIMPKGGIIMWAGSPTALPTGWTLCDGRAAVNLVTIPDLRERFIVGAGGDNTEIAAYDFNRFYVRATLSFNTYTTSTGGIPSLTSRNIDTYLTKVNESSTVVGDRYYNTYTDAVNVFPAEVRRYALYSFAPPTGADKTNSYFVVYNKDINKYRMYCGVEPSNNTSISNRFDYPYFDFPGNTVAELRSSRMPSGTKLVIYRPNVSQLEWEETTTGYAVGDIGGFNQVRQQISEMPSHNHTLGNIRRNNNNNNNYPLSFYDQGWNVASNTSTDYTGENFPHENRPPYYALAFIIYTGI